MTRLITVLALVGAGFAARANAEPSFPSYQPDVRAAGEIVCAGGDTMHDLVETWARELHARTPDIHVRVDRTSKLAADGFVALLQGQASCATFVREPFPSELDAFRKKFGYPPMLINIANGSYDTKGGTHAIAIYVNVANPLQRLDLSQLDAVFSNTLRRGAEHSAVTWGDLGLAGDWKRHPIHLYGMLHRRDTGNPPGIVNFLNQRVLLGGEFRGEAREQTDAPGESALQAIVNRIADDPDGIGYSGFGFSRPGVKRVAISERPGGPFYFGDRDEVQSRSYPLSRQIYILINRSPGQPVPAALREFLLFVLSREGQDVVAADHMHFLPLTANQAEVARKALE